MTEGERQARGRRAFAEMQEIGEVFAKLERGVFAELQRTPIGQDVKVQRLHMTLHNLAALQQAMREMIDDGRIAEAVLATTGLNRPT